MNGDSGRLLLFIVVPVLNQKSIHRPDFSQSPNRVGSGPFRPPISFGSFGALGLPDFGLDFSGVLRCFFVIDFLRRANASSVIGRASMPLCPGLLFYQESCEMRAL